MDSPIGTLLLMATRRGLVRIAFESENRDEVLGEVADARSRRGSSRRRAVSTPSAASSTLLRGNAPRLRRRRSTGRSPAPFARRVLRRTARIPYGSVASYGDVAHDIGTPRGARAVGNALGSNPIPVVVPCHRVVRTGGAIGGYGGGLPRKRWLLDLEAG